ncbi:MAG: winged helix-turn-helix domain-containing protein [Eubacteriales bacterium]|nr:winged helix-turn-helix domain-containing protein [Eubacteriales bacterium]
MIYSVEDDQAIRDLLLYTLRQAGYEAEGFEDGNAFQAALARRLPSLVLLDQMLPGMDGEHLLLQMRRDGRTRHIPVIMLTAKNSEMDKVRSLDNGADDYIVKPFGVMELLSRIRAVLRRGEKEHGQERLALGPLEMDVGRREVKVSGAPVSLTNMEFRLLHFLLLNPGLVFTRDQLLDSVWDTGYAGHTRTVDMHVRTLRVKLGQGAGCVRTVRGVGYKLAETGQEA